LSETGILHDSRFYFCSVEFVYAIRVLSSQGPLVHGLSCMQYAYLKMVGVHIHVILEVVFRFTLLLSSFMDFSIFSKQPFNFQIVFNSSDSRLKTRSSSSPRGSHRLMTFRRSSQLTPRTLQQPKSLFERDRL
jgi:hypothetical protein